MRSRVKNCLMSGVATAMLSVLGIAGAQAAGPEGLKKIDHIHQ